MGPHETLKIFAQQRTMSSFKWRCSLKNGKKSSLAISLTNEEYLQCKRYSKHLGTRRETTQFKNGLWNDTEVSKDETQMAEEHLKTA